MKALSSPLSAQCENVKGGNANNIRLLTETDLIDEPKSKNIFVYKAVERITGDICEEAADFSFKTFTGLGNRSFPESWFRKVKRFTIKDDPHPRAGKGRTVVKIYYHSRLRFRRKLTFFVDETEAGSVNLNGRPPEAQALVQKLRHATGFTRSRVRTH